MTLSINDIKTEMREDGSHWWDPDSMRFFGTKVESGVFQGNGGVFFVTSEQPPYGGRGFTVREYVPEKKSINTHGDCAGYLDPDDAIQAAKELADGDCEEVYEELEPVTELEQFIDDLKDHGCPSVSEHDARTLIELHAKCDWYAVTMCNRQVSDEEIAEHDHDCQLIEQICERIGCKVARIGGDPRGCVLKLELPDGYVNDFGKEGYCVPLPDTEEA